MNVQLVTKMCSPRYTSVC